MKTSDILKLLLATALLSIIGCTNNGKDGGQDKVPGQDSTAGAKFDPSFLDDANFPVKNLKSTVSLWKSQKFYNDTLYEDSTHKVAFRELTNLQKLKLIAPFIKNELHVNDVSDIENLMRAFFIAKQDKVGDFQPIVLYINGDDYDSLTLIVLNNENLPVSGLNLCGGEDGPITQNDSLLTYAGNNYSLINKNMVTTYRMIKTDYTDDVQKKPSIIDSNVFESVIDKKGKIVTKQTVKARYTRAYQSHISDD